MSKTTHCAFCTDCGADGAKQKYPGLSLVMSPPRCEQCQEICEIISSGADEAVRYKIPTASEATLTQVLRLSSSKTVRVAAARRLTKLAKLKGGAK